MTTHDVSVSTLNPKLVYSGSNFAVNVKRDDRWKFTGLVGSHTSGTKTVAISPVDSNIVIAAYRNAIFWPVVYESVSGGEEWDRVWSYTGEADVRDIVFDPVNSQRVYGLVVFPSGKGMLIISNDSGNTWNEIWIDSGKFSMQGDAVIKPLAINPLNNNEMYLLDVLGQVLKSSDQGVSWATVKTSTDTGHFAIVIDPVNPDDIYVSSYGIWKSSDGGEEWVKNNIEQWVLDLSFEKRTGNLYAATYGGGVFYSENDGKSWNPMAKQPANKYLHNIEIGEGENYSILYAGSFGSGIFEYNTADLKIENNGNEFGLIKDFKLFNNFPNPFNNHTTIEFYLQTDDFIELEIYDILGRSVITILSGNKKAGFHFYQWNGKDSNSRAVPSGVYFSTLTTSNSIIINKMLILR